MTLALAFLNPLLLGGLGLAAAPIIIHLLSRRRFRRIEWGATRFLLEAEKQNRRRVRFEQWLLVALRCLAMALLALLLARPFVQPGLVSRLLGGEGSVRRIVVIDDSASLAWRTGRGVEYAQLTEAAARLLAWLKRGAAGDPLTVYLTSRPETPLVASEPLRDTIVDDVQTRLRRSEPSNLIAAPRGLIERIASDLASGPAAAMNTDLYILSDFQRSDWLASDRGGRSVFAPLVDLEAAGSVRVVLLASDVGPRDNVAVRDVALERPHTIAGLPAAISVAVANLTRKALHDVPVSVEIEGAPQPGLTLEQLDAGQERRVQFEATFADEGRRAVSAAVGEVDGFPLDNVARAAVRVRGSLAVLLVNGRPSSDPRADAVYLVRSALAPPGPFSSGLRVEVIDYSEIESTDLSAFDVLMLCDVPRTGAGATAALERFVRGGGGLAIFLGGQVDDPADFNRALFADGAGLLPVALGALQQQPGESAGVGLVRVGDHPVTAMFPAGAAGLSESIRFRGFYSTVEPVRPDAAQEGAAASPPAGAAADAPRPPPVVLARFTDGAQTPALIERPLGSGRVLLFTSSADLEWNDWARALDGSYVVTLLEMVQYLARRDADPLAFTAGQRLTLSVDPEVYLPEATFRSPAYPDDPAVEAQRGAMPAQGQLLELVGPPATRLGTYRVELTRRAGGSESRPLCVNLDPAESDLSTATPVDLDAALKGLRHEYIRASESFLENQEQTRREIWPSLLLALALVLMGEQALAWWFGTPPPSATAAARRGLLGRLASWSPLRAPRGTR